MTYKLGTNIKVGLKILTDNGWRKVLEVTPEGARVKEGIIPYGAPVYGCKKG